MAEKKINGNTYQVGEVLATEAIRLQARVLKIVGGGLDRLPTILAGAGEDASEAAKAASNVAAIGALADIFGKCEPEEVTRLMSDVVSLATVRRPSGAWEQVDLDGDLTDRKADIFPLMVFVLKEVLGVFFSGALANGALRKMGGQG